MTKTRLTPEEYKNHCIAAIKGAQMGLEVALEAVELGEHQTAFDALSDAGTNTQAALLLAPMAAPPLKSINLDQIRNTIRETAELMREYSLSLSGRYASAGADRLAVAYEFATSQEHITPDFQSVALMAIRVANLENRFLGISKKEG